MSFLEAIIYGVIQGLSEFLPVSSSGHLALLPYIMKIDDPGVVFDLMMHLGTALAIIIYFWKDIKGYFNINGPSRWFVRNFIFSTFISVLAIFALMPVAKHARSAEIIVFNLSFFGGILWLADWFNSKRGELLDSPMYTSLQLRLAGLIGLAQALAIFPGVSRSGITLTAALILGMRRKDAGASPLTRERTRSRQRRRLRCRVEARPRSRSTWRRPSLSPRRRAGSAPRSRA